MSKKTDNSLLIPSIMMISFVFLFAAVVATSSSSPQKIVGGHDTDITEVPYQLSLEAWELIWVHYCGATIVSENVAISAAHCGDNSAAKQTRLRAGSSQKGKGTIHTIKSITIHPNYEGTDYDISVIVVKDPFEFSESVQPIPIAVVEPQENDIATVSGWGSKKPAKFLLPDQLQSVQIPIVSRNVCREDYGESAVTDRMICAGVPEGGKDSCQGDSGGPLAVNGTLAGVVSWGEGCARPNRPGVYTNVASVADWINQQIEAAKLNK